MTKKGQIWVETVLYTLIGLVLIAVVLAFATPKINATKDRVAIEQSIELMQSFSEKIDETLSSGTGTRIIIPSLAIKRGELRIDPIAKSIILEISDLTLLYSENGTSVRYGKLNVTSFIGQKFHTTSIRFDVPATLKYNGLDTPRTFTQGVAPYKFALEKTIDSGNIALNISELSNA